MKKSIFLAIFLSAALLFTACGQGLWPSGLSVSCFGCGDHFASGELNADFGLCKDCMVKMGAAYCNQCGAPCYTRDMVHGLCRTCNAAIGGTTAVPATAGSTGPGTVECRYCGYFVQSEYMVGSYCVGCYCVHFGKCLRCVHNNHLPDICHCEFCSTHWFYCADCGKHTAGSEMLMDLCMNCYWRINSVLVPCPLCGMSIAPTAIKGGYCESCYAQINSQPPAELCEHCHDREATTDGLCDACWGIVYRYVGTCNVCGQPYREGEGFESLCYSCQALYGPKCKVCGADLSYQGGQEGMCHACYEASLCLGCGSVPGDYYDGYCYYCYLNFGFTCSRCGMYFPEHRPESGLCPSCEGEGGD